MAQVYSFFHINDLTLMFVFSFVLHFFDISIDLFISNSIVIHNDVFFTPPTFLKHIVVIRSFCIFF